MNSTKTKLYLAMVGILAGLVVLYILSSAIIPQLLVTRSKAALSGKVNLASSYLLGGKTMARPDGKDKCVVNVFVRDGNDIGVMGRRVQLTGTSNIVPEEVATDAIGKAQFEITSTVEGQFKIAATVDGIPLNGKSVTVVFRD